jgi:hypothetical protein
MSQETVLDDSQEHTFHKNGSEKCQIIKDQLTQSDTEIETQLYTQPDTEIETQIDTQLDEDIVSHKHIFTTNESGEIRFPKKVFVIITTHGSIPLQTDETGKCDSVTFKLPDEITKLTVFTQSVPGAVNLIKCAGMNTLDRIVQYIDQNCSKLYSGSDEDIEQLITSKLIEDRTIMMDTSLKEHLDPTNPFHTDFVKYKDKMARKNEYIPSNIISQKFFTITNNVDELKTYGGLKILVMDEYGKMYDLMDEIVRESRGRRSGVF